MNKFELMEKLEDPLTFADDEDEVLVEVGGKLYGINKVKCQWFDDNKGNCGNVAILVLEED